MEHRVSDAVLPRSDVRRAQQVELVVGNVGGVCRDTAAGRDDKVAEGQAEMVLGETLG